MRLLEKGNDKVKKICEVLKKETLEPAKQQAEEILESANQEAEKIIRQAQEKAAHLINEADAKIRRQEEVFKASINIAHKQSIGKLKAEIRETIFNHALLQKISQELNSASVLTNCIKAIFEGVSKFGLDADAQLILSKNLSKEQVAAAIAQLGLEKIKDKVLLKGDFLAGVQIRIEKENLTVDLTDETVHQLILEFASENLKKLIFNQ